jgi:hypothetical protein
MAIPRAEGWPLRALTPPPPALWSTGLARLLRGENGMNSIFYIIGVVVVIVVILKVLGLF